MKKTVILILITVLMMNLIPSRGVAAQEYYGSLNVEYGDNKGTTETLKTMVVNNNVYVDAFELGQRLGYDVGLTKNGKAVYVYNDDINVGPLLLVAFNFGSTEVDYHVATSSLTYQAPFKAIHNKKGSWIPFKYALYSFNSTMLIVGDVVTITMPQNTLLSIMQQVADNQSWIDFDFYSDMTFSDGSLFWKNAYSRVLNLYSGLLEFEDKSWLMLLQCPFGDTSAFDDRFGEEFTTLFCTNADKELEELNKQIDLLTDIFETDGSLGLALQGIKTDINTNVDALFAQCNELYKNIERSNTDLAKYNATYKTFEAAFNRQTDFYATGQVALDVQGKLDSVTKKLSVLGYVLEYTGYISEFSEQDAYAVDALLEYVSRYDGTNMPEDLYNSLLENAELFKGNAGAYSLVKFIEKNRTKWIQSALKLSEQMGAQANLTLLAWNLASATIPFIKNGLESAKSFELSKYAYLLEADAFSKYWEYKNTLLNNAELINAEHFYELSQLLYTYLKAAYIARDAAIGGFEAYKNKADAQEVLQQWAAPNTTVATLLAELKMLSANGKDGSLGFLPDVSEWVVSEYDDSDLLKLFDAEYEEETSELTGSFDYQAMKEAYKKTLEQHPVGKVCDNHIDVYHYTVYLLYDIDKNGVPELIVGETSCSTNTCVVYTYSNNQCKKCGELYIPSVSVYDSLYEYDGNGILVYDGVYGINTAGQFVYKYSLENSVLSMELYMSSEEHGGGNVLRAVDAFTPIDDFYPIDEGLITHRRDIFDEYYDKHYKE